MTTKISAGIVVTANDRMDVWEPGYLIIRDGLIAEAGPGNGPEGAFDELVAAPRRIIMPGLVNGHAHSPSNLLKGSWAQLPLEIWRQYIRAGWREYSDEAIYVSAQIGLIEMIRTGCTSVMDHFYTGSPSPHMGALHAVAAMADAGMRGGLALTLSDQQYDATVGLDTGALSQAARDEVARISALEGEESLDDFTKFANAVRKRTHLVLPIVGPSAPHRCSVSQLSRCAALARELDTMVHMHVCETKGQFLQGHKLFGCTPVAHLDRIGALNERLSMAHCVWLTDEDIDRVAAAAQSLFIIRPATASLAAAACGLTRCCVETCRSGSPRMATAATTLRICSRPCAWRASCTIATIATIEAGLRPSTSSAPRHQAAPTRLAWEASSARLPPDKPPTSSFSTWIPIRLCPSMMSSNRSSIARTASR